MAFNLDSIARGPGLRPPRIIILGVEKVGKTTFAANSGFPLILPVEGEEGADASDIQAIAKVAPTCRSLAEVHGWLESLRTQQHTHGSVVIDSASTLEPIIHAEICSRNKAPGINEGALAYGVGRDQTLSEWRAITRKLDTLRTERNMVSIIIGHVRVRRFDDPQGLSYDRYEFDVHDKTSSALLRWADVILFANTKVVVREEQLGFHKDNTKKRGVDITDGARFLYTQGRPAHPGGGRDVFGRLPYELPLDWGAFMQAVSQATAAQTGTTDPF